MSATSHKAIHGTTVRALEAKFEGTKTPPGKDQVPTAQAPHSGMIANQDETR
jgi:hypothetical protein